MGVRKVHCNNWDYSSAADAADQSVKRDALMGALLMRLRPRDYKKRDTTKLLIVDVMIGSESRIGSSSHCLHLRGCGFIWRGKLLRYLQENTKCRSCKGK